MKRFLVSVVVLALAASSRADVIHLKDGSRVDGDVKKGASGYVVTKPDGKIQLVPSDQVKSIELAATPGSADAAKEKLNSLRRAVEYLDDPRKVVERYQRFIEQNAGTPIEVEARQDLTTWQDRVARKLVKFGSRWVTAEERAALQEKALRQADAARKLIKAGKLAEADSAIQQALAEDPQNAAALYLRGLLQFRQDQVIPSRKSFDQVNALVPNHAPTLNNLAVVSVRQNQIIPAMNLYDQAMTASPKTREVLNNVAELLYNIPDEQRNTPVAQKILRRFNEQDTELAAELQKQGLNRWGSTWVTNEQLDQLKEADLAAKDKLDALSAEFDSVKVRISNIDRDIAENERSMRRVESTSYVRDVNGQIWQTGLPSSYYAMQNDNRKLATERDQQFARLNQLREQAKAVNRDLPVPKYSGIQKLMDENFAPIVGPSPATQPSTKPSA